ncbi:MAG: DUF1566 domain-containing protein [Campylobacterota bacterium]|nr:DUF1566 domain-containing protein [Campylobacterota bacterium]
MKIILLIMIGLSILQAEMLRENDVVLDTQTKLMWQDDVIGTAVPWGAAIQRCEDLTLATYSDWRLPSVNELRSIVDRSKSNPAIVDGFTQTSSDFYWSSTSVKDYEYNAWGVRFYNGYVSNGKKDYNIYVRCVRDGQ